MSHTIKPGVASGKEIQAIHAYAKEKGFAMPAVNVVGNSSVNAVMETAAELNAPVNIQFSNGGCLFNAGKGFLMTITKRPLLEELQAQSMYTN